MQYDQVATQRSLLRMGSGKPARPVLPGVPLLMLLLATSRCLFPAGATQDDTMPEDGWYFWNTVTGEVQLDDPGDVPFETPSGVLYWLGHHGERIYTDMQAQQYSWIERWSEEYKKPFFYNQETQVSTWDRPPDLAWRRVAAQEL